MTKFYRRTCSSASGRRGCHDGAVRRGLRPPTGNIAVLAFYKRALPGVTIDEKSALAGIDEFVSDWSTPKTLVVQTAWNAAGVETMAELNGHFERTARYILTHFLINSNFFHVKDPRAQPIVYVSTPLGTACGNRLANLEPPA